MAVPSKGIQRFDLSISYSEFSLLANKKRFIATQLFPVLNKSYSGNTSFLRLVLKSLLKPVEDTKRAPRTAYKEDNFEWTDDSYKLEDHGVVELLDDSNLDKWGDIIRAESISAGRVVDRLLRALERDAADIAFSDSWANKNAGSDWTDYATATPIDDLENAIETVGNRVGVNPNTAVIPDTLWRHMVRCAQFEDKLDSGNNDNPNRISMAGFQTLFPSIERILIPSGRTNSADNEAAAVQLDRLWDPTRAMVCHVNDDGMDGDIEAVVPNIGRTLVDISGIQPLPGVSEADDPLIVMEEYRSEDTRGYKIRGRNYRQIKLLHEAAGQLLTALNG